MRMAFLIVVLVAGVAALGGFLYLGLHPPRPATHTVDHTLDNDHFITH